MSNKKNRALDIFSILVSILTLIVPSIFFIISAPDDIKAQSFIIFGIMIITIIAFSIVYLVYQGYRNMDNSVNCITPLSELSFREFGTK